MSSSTRSLFPRLIKKSTPLLTTRSPSSNLYICARCQGLSTTAPLASGHNRWSKIRHDKAVVDAKKHKARSVFAHDIMMASKLYGGDPNMNPKLATAIQKAKAARFPKASIEAAVLRGQGKSATGAVMETVTMEAIMPPSIAFVLEVESDNRQRALVDTRALLKRHGATVTPTAYMFQKRGRIVFERGEESLSVDDVLEPAIEAGAEDVEVDDEGNIVVWTDAAETTSTADALRDCLKLSPASLDVIYQPNEDALASIDSAATLESIHKLYDAIEDYPGIVTYSNLAQGTLDDAAWADLQDKIAV